MIQSEVSILRRVKHPNIVLLIEEMDTQNELYLVMELVKVLIFYFLKKLKPSMSQDKIQISYQKHLICNAFFLLS